MQPKIERRNYSAAELRAVSEGDGPRKIIGYAAIFNSLSEDLGGFREKIAPGCFARACKEADVRALMNHDSNYVIARTKSGTLRLSEDAHGLKIECDPPESQWVKDMMASIDRGDIDQMSFGFRTLSDEWNLVDGESVRTLLDVELFDVSVVAFPAYPDTTVGLRSLEIWKKAEEPKADFRTGLMKRKLELKTKISGGTRP
jgi:HK97 family phage prohead protease